MSGGGVDDVIDLTGDDEVIDLTEPQKKRRRFDASVDVIDLCDSDDEAGAPFAAAASAASAASAAVVSSPSAASGHPTPMPRDRKVLIVRVPRIITPLRDMFGVTIEVDASIVALLKDVHPNIFTKFAETTSTPQLLNSLSAALELAKVHNNIPDMMTWDRVRLRIAESCTVSVVSPSQRTVVVSVVNESRGRAARAGALAASEELRRKEARFNKYMSRQSWTSKVSHLDGHGIVFVGDGTWLPLVAERSSDGSEKQQWWLTVKIESDDHAVLFPIDRLKKDEDGLFCEFAVEFVRTDGATVCVKDVDAPHTARRLRFEK